MHLYNDGCLINTLDTKLQEVLAQNKLIDTTTAATSRVSFCGIITVHDTLHVFLPKCTDAREGHEGQQTARALLDTLTKYARTKGNPVRTGMNTDIEHNLTLLPVVHNLLLDYRLNGLYTTNKSLLHRGNGKTDWNRTFKKIIPLIRTDRLTVYPEFINKKIMYNNQNLITRIHAAIIAKLDKIYGWWVNSEGGNLIAPELKNITHDLDIETQKSLLKRELTAVFSEQKIFLIKNLLAYLEQQNTNTSNSHAITGLTAFHTVWEHMIATVTGDRKKEFSLPSPYYQTDNHKELPRPENTARPDSIITNETTIAVIDAKYYDTTISKPGWSDLVKQFFYATALKLEYPDKEICNCLVLPESKLPDSDRPSLIFVKGKHGRYDRCFAPVKCFYVRPEYLMKQYIENQKCHGLIRKILEPEQKTIAA